jgi:hypothetical protein
VRVKGGTGGQLSAEGGEGKRPSGLLFFRFLSGFRLLLSCALPSHCDLAPSSIAASLLHVSGTVRLSSPFVICNRGKFIDFFGLFSGVFSSSV